MAGREVVATVATAGDAAVGGRVVGGEGHALAAVVSGDGALWRAVRVLTPAVPEIVVFICLDQPVSVRRVEGGELEVEPVVGCAAEAAWRQTIGCHVR